VKINTGDMIKQIRADEMQEGHPQANAMAMKVANNMGVYNMVVPSILNTVDMFHAIFGPGLLESTSATLNKLSGQAIPTWNKYMPRGAGSLKTPQPPTAQATGLKVVYMPTCVTRTMGPARGDEQTEAVHDKLLSLFSKAGYEVVYPDNVTQQCCGMLFNSRGFTDAAATASSRLEEALMEASEGGKHPIVCDTSPCLATLKEKMPTELKFAMYEPVEFISKHMLDKLEFHKVKDSVAVHVPCSSKKMGIEAAFLSVASKCAHEVHPSGVPCCGMAGDRGMRYPELTGSSLQHLDLPANCSDGYSTSRTCEMSLSNHSGINFRGLVYLVDEATTAKKQAKA